MNKRTLERLMDLLGDLSCEDFIMEAGLQDEISHIRDAIDKELSSLGDRY